MTHESHTRILDQLRACQLVVLYDSYVRCRGNVAHMARDLGIQRTYLYRRLDRVAPAEQRWRQTFSDPRALAAAVASVRAVLDRVDAAISSQP